jgi:RNA polymerase sigma-70 factor, ECF subfamily
MLEKVQTPPTASTSRADDEDTPPEPTEAQLEALRRRDPDAIERWVYGNRGIVRGMLLKMVKDANLADELLQETFYQAMRSVANFRGDAKVSTWLCSIARNLAFRHFRKQERYTTVASDTLEWMGHEEMPDGGPFDGNPRHNAERTERTELVHAALQELPPSYRQVIRLRDLMEKSTEEVANELDLTRVNVRVRLHRARQKLEGLLRPKLAGTLARAA